MKLDRRAFLIGAGASATVLHPEPALALDTAKLQGAIDYAQSKGAGSVRVVLNGSVVGIAGSQTTKYDLMSLTKSLGSILLGAAIREGRVSLSDKGTKFLTDFGTPPSDNGPLAARVTLFQLATHTAGFAVGPPGYKPIVFQPGTAFAYSGTGVSWLADCLTAAFKQDLAKVFAQRTGVGVSWRGTGSHRSTINGVTTRELSHGAVASVDTMARVGQFVLGRGDLIGMGRTPSAIKGLPVRSASLTPGGAANHYGLLWWNNNDGKISGVPTDAFWGWGIGDSILLVVPSLELVVARAGRAWRSSWTADYAAVGPFFQKVVAAVGG
jgi:CubicO group peptidase (beta-lactamase class C family)